VATVMKESERAKGQKSSTGKFFAFFRQKGSANAKKTPAPPLPEPEPEPSAEELAAQAAERERVALELIKREKDSMVKASGSCLYNLYQYHHGLPPVTDENGCYSLIVFTEYNELPTDEERALLTDFDRKLALTFDYTLYDTTAQKSGSAFSSHSSSDFSVPGDDRVFGQNSAACHVLMPENALNAYLFITPPQVGGNGFTIEDVINALSDANVSFGVNNERIKAIVNEQNYLTIVKVAAGREPIDGKDGEVVELFQREITIKLKERADGTIDYRDLGWLQTTGAGDTICDIIAPLDPQDGVNVRGEPIAGNVGMKAAPLVGEGAVLSDDGCKLLSAIDGVVLFKQDRFHVEPLLTIENDVDTGIGNLDLIGSVIIHGDIRGGYSVKATGNITVQGRVENAFVKAGGSIQVGNGMNGSETGTLRAEGDVVCRYIEHSTVSAGHSVVSDAIVNSNVSAGNYIEVTTGRGTIVGGRIMARNRVQAQTLGNYGNTLTSVFLGDTLESMEEKQELTQKSITLGKELVEKEKSLKHLGQRPVLSQDDRKKSDDLRKSIESLRNEVQEVGNRLYLIERNRPPNTGCYLRAGVVHPPLELTISGVRTTVHSGTSGVRFALRSGEVVQIPY